MPRCLAFSKSSSKKSICNRASPPLTVMPPLSPQICTKALSLIEQLVSRTLLTYSCLPGIGVMTELTAHRTPLQEYQKPDAWTVYRAKTFHTMYETFCHIFLFLCKVSTLFPFIQLLCSNFIIFRIFIVYSTIDSTNMRNKKKKQHKSFCIYIQKPTSLNCEKIISQLGKRFFQLGGLLFPVRKGFLGYYCIKIQHKHAL